jgi:hypothetical protein
MHLFWSLLLFFFFSPATPCRRAAGSGGVDGQKESGESKAGMLDRVCGKIAELRKVVTMSKDEIDWPGFLQMSLLRQEQ